MIMESKSTDVSFFDIQLRKRYGSFLSVISVLCTFFLIFIDIPAGCKLYLGIIFLIFLIVSYALMWQHYKNLRLVNIVINGSTVEICFGDLFKEDGLKVIPFNEYFDTVVDDVLVSKTSLHGIFISNFIHDIPTFDVEIQTDKHMISKKIPKIDKNRQVGKKIKYKLGSIYKFDDFLLTSFSHFDEENRAYLSTQDYINCLLSLWDEIDIVYAGKTVVLPLLGSGINRFHKNESISEQELLDLILWTLRVSKIRFKGKSKVKIVLDNSIRSKVSLFKFIDFYKTDID